MRRWRCGGAPRTPRLADEEFVRPAAVRLDQLRLDAEAEWADAALSLGRADEAVLRLEPLVRAHPLQEALRSRLVLALYRAGRQADALQRYAELARHRPLPTAPGAARASPASGPELAGPTRHEPTTDARPVRGGRPPVLPRRRRFFKLGGVQHADAVSDAVATALGVQGRQEVSVSERIVEYLRPLRLLLVLDNCEHVAAAAARVTEAVAGSCPGVTILTTSREPLGTDREWVLPVAPLAVPPPGEGDSATVAAAPAVRLLLERAAAAAPGFAIDDGNAPAVAALVRRLDGLPLALELAAPRLRAMAPAELIERLDGRFGLLRARSGPERHRTLSALVDWSHELLTPPERHCFARLAVFAGPFDLAAAEAVCGEEDDDGDEFDVTTVVADLVDRSMLAADTSTRPTRYSMLETLRAFGRARLAASSAEEVARRAHATYVVAHAEVADRGLRGAEEAGWTDELIRCTDDLRAAHGWALQADPDLGARLAAALVWFSKFHLRLRFPAGPRRPGRPSCERAPRCRGCPRYSAWPRPEPARAATTPAQRSWPSAESPQHGTMTTPTCATRCWCRAAWPSSTAGSTRPMGSRTSPPASLGPRAIRPGRARHGLPVHGRHLPWRYGHCRAARRGRCRDRRTHRQPDGDGLGQLRRGRGRHCRRPRSRRGAARPRPRARYWGAQPLPRGRGAGLGCRLHGRHGDPAVALRLSAEVIDHWHRAGNRTQQWTTIRNVVELLSRRDEDSPAAVLDAAVASRTTAAPAFGDAARRLELARARMRSRLDPATYAAATARGRSLTDDEVVALARRAVAQVAEPSPIS